MLKRIGTHSGSFHCDEVMACFLLHNTSEFSNSPITRTRDKSVLSTLDIIVDVGDEFDPSRNRFDHHQKSFTDVFGGRFQSIRMSSAGLIWKYFGKEVIQSLCGISDPATTAVVHDKMYSDLFQCLDAVDNGIAQYDTHTPERFRDCTSLPVRVSRLNPSWREEEPDYDAGFYKAMALVGREFREILEQVVQEWLPARGLVEKYLLAAREVHESGKIMVLEKFCPWKDHLYELEKEHEKEGVIYVLYLDSAKTWKIQAVGVSGVAFASRLPLPEAWWGKRGEELAKVAGIEGVEFVHATGFIGGGNSFECVMKMAKLSLGISDESVAA